MNAPRETRDREPKMPESWRKYQLPRPSAWAQIRSELRHANPFDMLCLGIVFGGGIGACIAILLGWKG